MAVVNFRSVKSLFFILAFLFTQFNAFIALGETRKIPNKFPKVDYLTIIPIINAKTLDEMSKYADKSYTYTCNENIESLQFKIRHDHPFLSEKYFDYHNKWSVPETMPDGFALWRNIGSCPTRSTDIYVTYKSEKDSNVNWAYKYPYEDKEIRTNTKYCYQVQAFEGTSLANATGVSQVSECVCATIKVEEKKTEKKSVEYRNSEIGKKCSEEAKKHFNNSKPKNLIELCQLALFNKCVEQSLCTEYPNECKQLEAQRIEACNELTDKKYLCSACF